MNIRKKLPFYATTRIKKKFAKKLKNKFENKLRTSLH